MITALANHIADFIYSNAELSEEQRDVYVYGYEVIISSVITFVLLIITGIIFKRFFESMAFFLVFYSLRQHTGGYHADTYLKCNLIFEFNIILVMILSLIDFSFIALLSVNIVSFVLCFTSILTLAPMENKNKPISPKSKKTHKLTGLILAVVFEAISLYLLGRVRFSFCISMAMASTSLAMLINLKGRRQKS